MGFESHNISGACLNTILIKDLLMEARLRTALRPTSTVKGLITGLTLLILTVCSIDHTTNRKSLGSPMLDYENFVDV